MFSLFVRQALARRPALNTLTNLATRLPTLSSSSATLPSLVVAARPRFFSLSAPLAFPTTKKKTTKRATSTASRKKPTKTIATKKKKTTARTASKSRPASKSRLKARRSAPKKRVAKRKTAVAKTKKKKVPKKVVPKVETPRNTPRLRPPPRQMPAFGVFYQRMYRTLSPKPVDIKEAFLTVQKMWGALSEAEKEGFRTEARDISAQRKLVYDKWRHGLSTSDVLAINKYRTTGNKAGKGRSKLGRDHLSTTRRPLNGFLKYLAEMRSTGQIDPNTAPEGVNKVTWVAKEAGARWRAMSDAEKKVYK